MSTKFDYIHGQRWHEIADVVIDMGIDPVTRQTVHIRRGIDLLGVKPCIIFCKTDYLQELFYVINSRYRFEHHPGYNTLITHNSDFPITEAIFKNRPSCIGKWYAQNVAYKDDNLIPIPIGLERPLGGGISSDTTAIDAVIADGDRSVVNCMYMNHADCNNKSLRSPITKLYSSCEWVTYERNVPFNEYLSSMRKHSFAVSPEGNGIDCHRTWEALYVGAYPIVKRSIPMEYFEKFLPILVVDDLTSLSQHELMDTWKVMHDKELNGEYIMDYLNFETWAEMIIKGSL